MANEIAKNDNMKMIKPGATSLNMYDIANNLELVHGHISKVPAVGEETYKDENGETKKRAIEYREDGLLANPVKKEYVGMVMNADDTDLVAGVHAKKIAVAASEGDRETVKNALQLGGHPADYYLSVDSGSTMRDKTTEMAKFYGDGIASLRDEIYQLKHELEKKGIIRQTQHQFGYSDIFSASDKPYEHEMLGRPTSNCPDKVTIPLDEATVKELSVGDFIAINYKKEQRTEVRQIAEIGKDGESIKVDEDLTGVDLTPESIELYKSCGVSQDGCFYFAQPVEYKMDAKPMWTGLDDDTAPMLYRPISEETGSYAYSFRIPENKMGYLTEFQISAKAKGTPTLTCYIIDEQDIGNFRNPEQAKRMYENGDANADGEPKMHFFAKSKPVQLDPTLGESIVSFDFWNEERGSYPVIDRKDTETYRVRYIAVICGTYVDDTNYASVRFIRDAYTKKDLEYNNTLYKYTRQDDSSLRSALTSSAELNDKDLYYSVILHGIVENKMKALNRGLYTAKLERPEGQNVSRARLMLRFKREGGLWNAVIDNTDVYAAGKTNANAFDVEVYTNDPNRKGSIRSAECLGLSETIHKPIELRDPIRASDTKQRPLTVIGNNIVYADANGTKVAPHEAAYVHPDDMVYRLGYIVRVHGRNVVIDPTTSTRVVKDEQTVYLKPVAVIRDGHKTPKDVYSDRVIFEGDFIDKETGKPKFFNELELQVFWEKPTFSEDQSIADEQMGVMRDLVFSVDAIEK